MDWWQALILGIVEGATEYLPVSSTGHLIVAMRAIGLEKTQATDAYAICIQSGAILAVLGLYRVRFRQMAKGLLGRDRQGRELALNLTISFGITGVLGLAFNHWIEEHLFLVSYVVMAWLVGGLAILLVAWSKRGRPGRVGFDLDTLGWKQAAVIGLSQALAMWPGTSRSLITIAAGLLLGMSISAAVEFSFLLGVVTLLAAGALKAYQSGPLIMDMGLVNVLIGIIVAAFAAWISIKWMVTYLRRHGLAIFGYYRIAIGVVVGLLVISGWLPDQIKSTKVSVPPRPIEVTVPAAP